MSHVARMLRHVGLSGGTALWQACSVAQLSSTSTSVRMTKALLRLVEARLPDMCMQAGSPINRPSVLSQTGCSIVLRGMHSSACATGLPAQLPRALLGRHPTARSAVAGWGGASLAKCSTAAAAAPAAGIAGSAGRGAARALMVGGEALTAGVSPGLTRQLKWWMAGTAAWVYTLVVLGGITRLTRSGLSMTDWKFTGERPPITTADWEAEFDKYRASPEFKLIHSRMTLNEFKFIFWMEYGHRMWGRALGLTFAVPCAYFVARGAINGALGKRLGLLFFMGGTQGLVGWWMVRSGLQEPEHEWQQVRVSPYRLAGHLVSAFAIFATLTWTALDLGCAAPLSRQLSATAQAATARVRRYMLPLAGLVAVTATSGAFVAGMDAGHAYNEFPLMGGQWVPAEYWYLWDKGYKLRNFFENTAAVQFDHRLLATTTASLALGLWAWVRSHPVGMLPRRAVLAADLMAAVTLAQWGLGVWTLLEYVPVHLGSAHQANALNLFMAMLVVLHALRPANPSPTARLIARLAAPAAMTAVAGVAWAVTTHQ